MRNRRNHAWILSSPTVVLPRGMWRGEARNGAVVRYGRDARIEEGAVGVNGQLAGICMVAIGADGTKTVLTRFARPMV